MMILKHFFFYSCLVSLIWRAHAQRQHDENPNYGIQIKLKGLCGDLPDSKLSLAFKTELESLLLEFYTEIHSNDDSFDASSISISESDFEQSTECPDAEELSADGSRLLTRTLLYTTMYFYLNGYCYGSCPSNPSSGVDTVNRVRRRMADEEGILLQKLRGRFPEISEVVFGDTGSKIDCSLSANCESAKGICCGVDSCGCVDEDLVLCSSPDSCKKTKFPSCLHDLSCDNSISITPDRRTLAVGSGFLDEKPSVEVYDYDSNHAIWLRRGGTIVETTTVAHGQQDVTFRKRGGKFGSSVALTDDGMTLASGAFNQDSVTIFSWSTSSNEWIKGVILRGPPRSMYGVSIDFARNPNLLTIGAPKDVHPTKPESDRDGSVYVYKHLPRESAWLQFGSAIRGNVHGGRLGWRVAMSPDGYSVSSESRKNKRETSYEWSQSESRWVENSKIPSYLPVCSRASGNNNQCQNTFITS